MQPRRNYEETLRHFKLNSGVQIPPSVRFLSAVLFMTCLEVLTLSLFALYIITASGRACRGQVRFPSSGSNGGNALRRFGP